MGEIYAGLSCASGFSNRVQVGAFGWILDKSHTIKLVRKEERVGHESHDRNNTESAVILALAYRAGLASQNGIKFTVEPATLEDDSHNGFDLILRRNGRKFYIDATASRKFKGRKITRTVGFAKSGGLWVYILQADWSAASFDICANPCFDGAWPAYVEGKDGQEIAFSRACPKHGNKCEFAKNLYEFSSRINNSLANSSARDAKHFLMEVNEPPF
ncbi:MAG TPA: hypothetical protein ENI09_01470 [candidate division WWE3 bacterium]|uniref:Uncharacterized protein n=1 Tax=candidate division WWE3 bacterium TaxID=2053526 RepID=A0A7C1SRQ4_UNCKA|nr:hypothetical protein [candidate division WWE3 bacterium]